MVPLFVLYLSSLCLLLALHVSLRAFTLLPVIYQKGVQASASYSCRFGLVSSGVNAVFFFLLLITVVLC